MGNAFVCRGIAVERGVRGVVIAEHRSPALVADDCRGPLGPRRTNSLRPALSQGYGVSW